jgi:NOL1/NOP2/fmu family ribosome biogenesis protein
MEKLRVLNSREVRDLLAVLNQQFGFKDRLDYVFLANEKSRIFLTNRDFSRLDLKRLRINSVGLYFGELKDDKLRVSIEGSQLVGPKSTKNVVDVTEQEMVSWLRGNDLDKHADGFVILRHKSSYLGCGRAKDGRIINFVPKTRRINI